MNLLNFYLNMTRFLSRMKEGEKFLCENCVWRVDMSDCEQEGYLPGSCDLCEYPLDVESIKDEMTGKKNLVVRKIRCLAHRQRDPVRARLENWCGKEARWFLEKD